MRLSHILPFLASLTAAISTRKPVAREDVNPSPPDNEVQMTGVVFSGSGCAVGSVSVRPSLPSSVLALHFDNFVAQSGGNISASSYRKNCQLSARIRHPSGWQFSMEKVNYRGYARIPVGITGVFRATYYFSPSPAQVLQSLLLLLNGGIMLPVIPSTTSDI